MEVAPFTSTLKVKSESRLVLSDSLWFQGLYGILQARVLEWAIFPLSRGFSQPRSPTLQEDSLPESLQNSCWATREAQEYWSGKVAYPFSSGSSWPRNWTRVSCIAGGLFTNWAIVTHYQYFFSCFCNFMLCWPTDLSSKGKDASTNKSSLNWNLWLSSGYTWLLISLNPQGKKRVTLLARVIDHDYHRKRASLIAQLVKNLPAM